MTSKNALDNTIHSLVAIDGAKSERQHQIKVLHDRGLDSRGILAATVDGLLGSISVEFVSTPRSLSWVDASDSLLTFFSLLQ